MYDLELSTNFSPSLKKEYKVINSSLENFFLFFIHKFLRMASFLFVKKTDETDETDEFLLRGRRILSESF